MTILHKTFVSGTWASALALPEFRQAPVSIFLG